MTRHALFPWWTEPCAFGTIVHDANSRRIAEVFRGKDEPATARLIKVAPVLLLDLKMTVACLLKGQGHRDLAAYLQRTIAAAEEHTETALEIAERTT